MPTKSSNCEHSLPPSAVSNGRKGMPDQCKTEENTEYNARCQRWPISIWTFLTRDLSDAYIPVDENRRHGCLTRPET